MAISIALAKARAGAVRQGKLLGQKLFPGELTYGGALFPCSIGTVSFFSRIREGGGGRNAFKRMTVTIMSAHAEGVEFKSGAQVVVRNLSTDEVWHLEVASGNDMIGREENTVDTAGNVTLSLIDPDQYA